MEVTCDCGRTYTYTRKDRKGHTTTKCNSCMANSKRVLRKQQAIAYKGGACLLCGYSKCASSLTFHHIDPEQKDFQISYGTYSWDTIKIELDKCVLLCSNCHGEVHAGVTQLP